MAATKQSRHMSLCVGHAVVTCDWECPSRAACCPRRDAVRGWQYRDGLCFLVAPLKRLANVGGERGAMINERDEDVCCFDCRRVGPFAHFRFGQNTPCCKQHGESKRTEHEELRHRPRVRVTASGIGSALREVDTIQQWFFNCCAGAVSAYTKQEFSAVPDFDDPHDAKLESSCDGKRRTLKANTFGCNLV